MRIKGFSFSEGNSKMHRVGSFSVLPVTTCAQTVYTRAIESKGADGSNSASAFCVFGWISPSGEIEGPLREMHRS